MGFGRINWKARVLLFALLIPHLMAQTVDVDVNWNIEHRVGGISDFGRERHITVHSCLIENDWNGEEDKLDYDTPGQHYNQSTLQGDVTL